MTSPRLDNVPRVSVAMAVYNGEAFLAEAIESVLSQTFTDFEFLIHDDGSTDGSLGILRRFAQKDSRVIVSHDENQGLVISLNLLCDRARGDLVARFDADDICLPDRFALQVQHMDTHPDRIVLGGRSLIIDDAGRSISVVTPPELHDEIDQLNLQGIVALNHPTVMIRRSALIQVDGYDQTYHSAQDHELWLRLGEIGTLANLPDVLIKYRIHAGSISGSRRDEQRANCLRACEAAWQRRGVTATFEYGDWRMDDTKESKLEFYLNYAWKAWMHGFRDTWRHYAWKAVKLSPGSKNAWKALVMGTLKRPQRRS
jgi:glycosyltransferase involved in cell wall biosynthesis